MVVSINLGIVVLRLRLIRYEGGNLCPRFGQVLSSCHLCLFIYVTNLDITKLMAELDSSCNFDLEHMQQQLKASQVGLRIAQQQLQLANSRFGLGKGLSQINGTFYTGTSTVLHDYY